MRINLDCRTCDDVLKRERGCINTGILPFLIGNERYFRCPIKLVPNVTWEYIRAYRFYKLGLLPSGTSYLNESQKYIDGMTILDNEFARVEEEQMKESTKGKR